MAWSLASIVGIGHMVDSVLKASMVEKASKVGRAVVVCLFHFGSLSGMVDFVGIVNTVRMIVSV